MIGQPPATQQPLSFGSFRNWLTLLWQNRGVDHRYLGRGLQVTLTSSLTAPLRVYERFRFSSAVGNVCLHKPPIFIVGHWRSGTTLLHYLLCQNKNLGFVSTFQSIAPECCLVGRRLLKPYLSKFAPSVRMMDDMPISLDTPQEEEVAIAAMCPFSFYHHWSFPRQARFYFDKYVMFHDLSNRSLELWKAVYLSVLKKATLLCHGKQLVLKSPVNTARISVLAEMFPEAKFIHMFRNPYRVYASANRAFAKIYRHTTLQEISEEEIRENVIYVYRQMLLEFLREKQLIPARNLREVCFEEFEKEPESVVRDLHELLEIPGFEDAQVGIREYLHREAGYQKTTFKLTRDDIDTVDAHWQFAVSQLGYRQPDPT